MRAQRVAPDRKVERANTLASLRHRMAPVFKKHGVVRAIVFGSHARADASAHSDLDLIVVEQTTKRYFDRFDGLYLDLCHAVRGVDIDLFVYTPAELRAISGRRFIRDALATGKTIYESHKS